jgi:hypothetical protein
MSKVIENGLKHFRAKAARYRKLAEKAEAEVARLEALSQGSNPTPLAPDAAMPPSAEPLSGLESVPAVESDTQPRK